jgi:hypothetical protein
MKMLPTFIGGVLGVIACVVLITGNALAQAGLPRDCVPTAEARTHHNDSRLEAPIVIGVLANGHVMEIWRNEDGSRFAVTLSNSEGITCMVGQGTGLNEIPWELKKPSVKPSGLKS